MLCTYYLFGISKRKGDSKCNEISKQKTVQNNNGNHSIEQNSSDIYVYIYNIHIIYEYICITYI